MDEEDGATKAPSVYFLYGLKYKNCDVIQQHADQLFLRLDGH